MGEDSFFLQQLEFQKKCMDADRLQLYVQEVLSIFMQRVAQQKLTILPGQKEIWIRNLNVKNWKAGHIVYIRIVFRLVRLCAL